MPQAFGSEVFQRCSEATDPQNVWTPSGRAERWTVALGNICHIIYCDILWILKPGGR